MKKVRKKERKKEEGCWSSYLNVRLYAWAYSRTFHQEEQYSGGSDCEGRSLYLPYFPYITLCRFSFNLLADWLPRDAFNFADTLFTRDRGGLAVSVSGTIESTPRSFSVSFFLWAAWWCSIDGAFNLTLSCCSTFLGCSCSTSFLRSTKSLALGGFSRSCFFAWGKDASF